jgi:hypothetical protein
VARRAGRPAEGRIVRRAVLRGVPLTPALPAVRPAADRTILPAAIHRPRLVLRARILPLVTLAQVRITPPSPWDRVRILRHTLRPRRLRSPRKEAFSRSFAILSTGLKQSRRSPTFGSRFARARIARSLRPSHQRRPRRSWKAICDAPSAKAKHAHVLQEKFKGKTEDASPRPRITPGAQRGNPGTAETARLLLINARATHTGMERPAWPIRNVRPSTPGRRHSRTRCERLKRRCKAPARIIRRRIAAL